MCPGCRYVPRTAVVAKMKASPGTAWTDVIANPDFGEGTMNVWVADQLGNNFDFTLGNGQNFFTLTATNGEVITDVQMTQQVGSGGTFGWNDFQQPRVSGVCTMPEGSTTCTPISFTPEPGSLALLGSGLVGLVESRGVAKIENVPFLLLSTYATVPYRNVRALML